MADVLIRDVPEDVLAAVDAHAARQGLSRVEYIRRRLAADAASRRAQVSSTGPVIAAMPVEYLVPKAEDLAREIQLLLAERGQHRALSVADILIAATAALAGLTVLHLDTDFDLIADLTGQPVERLRT